MKTRKQETRKLEKRKKTRKCENMKTRKLEKKKENKNLARKPTKKTIKKKRKFLFFLDTFLVESVFSFFFLDRILGRVLVFFYKFPPLEYL